MWRGGGVWRDGRGETMGEVEGGDKMGGQIIYIYMYKMHACCDLSFIPVVRTIDPTEDGGVAKEEIPQRY
jgi:hypothetical protein